MPRAAPKNVFCLGHSEHDLANNLLWHFEVYHPRRSRGGRWTSSLPPGVLGRVAIDITIDEEKILSDSEVAAIGEHAARLIRDSLGTDQHGT